ncbi:tumor necrosis factor receptor superfamily member 6B [Austrofundulus limnaeus]|uniref:Tumor necrosis factor receptor superfamily member 6B n=1 Tax=Austrofundulus limnaeus TaxID=52670 RepID=A0A2I4BPP8_AUSLI|nr:PREDICTED: tumor necrosis factor receptor superfamily member 6B-like [Austrofundulus limnaeus]
MLFLTFLVLLHGVTSASEPVPTYNHQNPFTGGTLTCNRCPPGTHLAAHCTATAPTKCAPCRSDHFTELWNYLPRCLYCNNICTQNQEVETECSPVSNRVCRCKAGFYMMDDFCMRHSECGLGHGVQTKGTPQKDTVCERCSTGYFSNSSSAMDVCVQHQNCTDRQLLFLNGSSVHDTVCGTCEDFTNGGETLRAFLLGVISSNKMRRRDLKRFVHRIIHRSDEDYVDMSFTRQRGPLLDQIRSWLAQAPVHQLKELPKTLRDSDLSSVADRLHNKLSEIKRQNPTCSLV